MTVYIPNPCHENWNNMVAAEKGKFCNACAKQVIDFSMMSDTQILNYFKDPGRAKDAVMDIYQELLAKLPNHEVENFRGWLYVVAKNHCLMHLRKTQKNITVEFSPALMQSEDFSHLDSVLDKEQDFIRLENCIDKLPAEQKQGIQMFYLESKCYNEIGEITGYEWGKVRSLIQNGRRNLKICMEKND